MSQIKRPTPLSKLSHAKGLRRALRRSSPTAERILWSKLRNRQLLDCKFRRQHSFENYVVDFYCEELRLVIELDGDSHHIGNADAQDRIRQDQIEQYGVRFLRFSNPDVFDNLDGVLETIANRMLELRDAQPDSSDTDGPVHPSP